MKSTVFLISFVIFLCCGEYGASADHTDCSSIQLCKCTRISDFQLIANCSSLGLKTVPNFSSGVTIIDLSKNNISSFESDSSLPSSLLELNISHNSFSNLGTKPFTGLVYLRFLSLEGNKLDFNSYGKKIFQDLKNLKILNVKNNFDVNRKDVMYPDKTFSVLNNLEALKIDGIQTSGFGIGFSKLKKLRSLDLSGSSGRCNIKILTSTYFINVQFLQTLDVSHCNILRIENETFRHLRSLKSLDISENIHLSFRVLTNITSDLQYTSIKMLKVNKIHKTFGVGTELFIDDIKYLKHTSIEKLYFDRNRLEIIQSGVFAKFPDSVWFLSFAGNRASIGLYGFEFLELKSLKTFIWDDQYSSQSNHVGDLLKEWNKDSCDIEVRNPCTTPLSLPYQHSENLKYDNIEEMGKFSAHLNHQPVKDIIGFSFDLLLPLPPKLEHVSVRNSYFKHKITKLHFGRNVIKYIDLSGNLLIDWEGPLINVANVTYLDLSNNYCSKVSGIFFDDFEKLTTLILRQNILGSSLSKDKNGLVFKRLKNLETLDLSENRISFLSQNVFKGLLGLKCLDLNNNLIKTLKFTISHMQYLHQLLLSNNQINNIPNYMRDTIAALVKLTNITIDMKGNPINCFCKNLDYLKWMFAVSTAFVEFTNYTCEDSNKSFHHLDQVLSTLELQCASKLGLISAATAIIVFFVIVVGSGMIYRYRWKLRYIYYMAKSRYQGYSSAGKTGDNHNYEYDAFISYADEDKSFVITGMRKYLENDSGLSLCIHHRDFIPGIDIAENITNAIHKSRFTVVVLSQHFLKSYWCNYEFNMARMESIYSRDGRDVLFLILYADISIQDIPFSMMELIDAKSYIEYPNDEYGNIVFWKKIKETLIGRG